MARKEDAPMAARMRRSVVASLVLVGFAWRSAFADCDAEEELVGYTILAHTSVNGDFEGCDFDRVIRYANGMKTTRAGYSYTYSYGPDATVYAGPTTRIGPKNGFCGGCDIKVCIEDELYDMEPILIAFLHLTRCRRPE
jgi:hypothetical protein